jgi:hypothetical protein
MDFFSLPFMILCFDFFFFSGGFSFNNFKISLLLSFNYSTPLISFLFYSRSVKPLFKILENICFRS